MLFNSNGVKSAIIKDALRLTTVFVRQGHYALESAGTTIDPPPDLGIECIGELIGSDLLQFLPIASIRATTPDPQNPKQYPKEQI